MRKSGLQVLALLIFGSLMFTATASAGSFYAVTVTNISKGMTFTPIMVATTKRPGALFSLGGGASAALEAMAETGNLGPLEGSLNAYDVTNSSFLPFLAPGESVTQYVATNGRYKYVNVAAMLVPSNDVFFAVNGIAGPRGNKSVTVTAPAYDSGTELNDELCISLPGPGCGMDPGPASAGEGYVYISPGIRGVGDLDADALDWNNPVAVIHITRIGGDDDDDDDDD
jgi:hypothetical protein